MTMRKRLAALALVCVLALGAVGAHAAAKPIEINAADYPVKQGASYTSMEEVAVYLTTFGTLPENFITKKQAQALGWDSRAGNLGSVAPGKSIGGDYFGNFEGNVPDAKGRKWTECDIDADGGFRNGLRLVFSNDGLLYYSDDHYESFRQVLVSETSAAAEPTATTSGVTVQRGKAYVTRDEVAAYLHQFGQLPDNYLTRKQAQALGFSNKKDNLASVAPGCAIGGDSFGNREGLLPDAKGREWFECDVNTVDGKRSDERIVWSNDGLIYYTPDNHNGFERLY